MLDNGHLSLDSCDFAPHSPRRQSRCSRTVLVIIIDLVPIIIGMPKGLKETSSVVAISAGLVESAANTFTQGTVDLNLDPLNNEVFVVLAVDINLTPPDAQANVDSNVKGSISTTSRTALGTIADSNVLAESALDIRAAGYLDGGVSFTRLAGESPTAMLDYIGIIATNDFFIQLEGAGNLVAKNSNVRVWGYRARADASIYAALVQSEVLSS